MRFKCVSKFYNSLTVSNAVFMNIHQCRSMNCSKFLVREVRSICAVEQKEDGNVSLLHIEEFDKLDTRQHFRLMCVNGLFCSWYKSSQPVAIFNPSTREIRFLPEVEHVDDSKFYFSLGFDPEEKMYKLLMTSTIPFKKKSTRNWGFSLGIDESWREIKTIADVYMFNDAICINGVIYRLSYFSKCVIVVFDVKSKTFRIVPLWIGEHDSTASYYMLIEVKGKEQLQSLYSCGELTGIVSKGTDIDLLPLLFLGL
ncbi:putative F-box protein At1g32420 [Nicotiana tomentosiformis]|uniref:putative F-box protein At1g32420 n=1 Tax=Nicotiana tomentosiformis TaxID=4098 RepID=UPI00051C9513